jgi:hypothetical protein
VCTANVSRNIILSVLVTTAIASRIVIAARVTVMQNSGRFGSGVGMDDGLIAMRPIYIVLRQGSLQPGPS